VETLFTVPLILERGAAWWTGLGGGHGTKVFGLSGHVARPGVIEAELGLTLRDLLERMGGGAPDARTVTTVALGGPSGILVPPRRFDEPLVPGGNPNPGTGGVAALHAGVPVAEAVRVLLDFNTRESCGKCTPCREGTARLRDMLGRALALLTLPSPRRGEGDRNPRPRRGRGQGEGAPTARGPLR